MTSQALAAVPAPAAMDSQALPGAPKGVSSALADWRPQAGGESDDSMLEIDSGEDTG